MALQAFTTHERMAQAVNHILFLGGKGIWVRGVKCRPQLIAKFIILAVNGNDTAFLVNKLHETTVHHIPLGMLHRNLSREFELYYRYCLMHLRNEAYILLVEVCAFLIHTWLIDCTWVIGILFHCKCSKRNHIYRIAILECRRVGIAQ